MDGGELMRRGDVMRALGLSKWTMRLLVQTGALRPTPRLYPGQRALFRRVDVEALVQRKVETGNSKLGKR